MEFGLRLSASDSQTLIRVWIFPSIRTWRLLQSIPKRALPCAHDYRNDAGGFRAAVTIPAYSNDLIAAGVLTLHSKLLQHLETPGQGAGAPSGSSRQW
jgi:hypothetical protein